MVFNNTCILTHYTMTYLHLCSRFWRCWSWYLRLLECVGSHCKLSSCTQNL